MRRTLDKGIVAITGFAAVLLLVCTVLPFALLEAGASPASWALDKAWPYLSVMAFMLAAIMPLIMLALYSCQIKETGVLGLIGLTISLIGFLGYLCIQFDMAFIWPLLAERVPEFVEFDGPMFRDSRFGFVHFWMGPVHTAGMLLFCLALIKARVFPRTACVLFIIGMILSPAALFPPFMIRSLGGVTGALGLGWLALTLWRRISQEPV